MLNPILPGYQVLSPLPFGLITYDLGWTHMDHHTSNQITINTHEWQGQILLWQN